MPYITQQTKSALQLTTIRSEPTIKIQVFEYLHWVLFKRQDFFMKGEVEKCGLYIAYKKSLLFPKKTS